MQLREETAGQARTGFSFTGSLEELWFLINEAAESLAHRSDVVVIGHWSPFPLHPTTLYTDSHHRQKSRERGRLFERQSNFTQERLGIP
jgi:hypothetical protein